MPPQIAELNRILQNSLFAIYTICAVATLFMGWRIFSMNKAAAQNRTALRLYTTVAIWIGGFGCVGIMRNTDAAENVVHLAYVASAFWLAWCPEYLMQSAFFPRVGKIHKVLHRIIYASVILFIISLMLKHESAQFVLTTHGLAYVDKLHGLMLVYFVGLFTTLILLGIMIVEKWKTTILKREKKVVYYLTAAYALLIASTLADFLIPMTGLIMFPIGTLASFTIVWIFYYARVALDGMSINAQIASKHIYEMVPMPVLIIQADHTIVEANQYTSSFFDEKIKKMLGQPVEHYMENEFVSLKEYFIETVNNKKETYEVSAACLSNQAVCSLRYNLIYDNYGEFLYAVLILHDMSQHYAMLKQLEESRNLAEVANAAKTAFLTNMSHEIRTPLNVILGMNEMILREAQEPHIAQYAGNIKNAAESMLYMVSDILDMSKMETEHLEITPVEYELKKMLRPILKSAEAKAKAKNLQFEFQVDYNLPSGLIGDETRIGQIISKFLSNAIKYTMEGKIVLRISGELKPDGAILLYIEVEDTGIGIREEDMDKLFRTFSRVNLRENRAMTGLGLGLAIIKKLTQAMEGDVSVRSEYGKGSVFLATVPQKIANANKLGDFQEWYNSFDVLGTGKEARRICAPEAQILAVDDTSVNLEVVKALLKRTKMQVDTVLSGAECLEMVKKKAYHIILMDHMMPEMDGIETLQQLKNMDDNLSKNAVVIALTANAVTGAREFYLENGFDDYLKKPVKSIRLEEMLAKYLPKELLELQYDENVSMSSEEWVDKLRFDHINVRKGLVYTDNNYEILQSVMKQYLHGGEHNLKEIEKAFEQKDWKLYEILVHALKSTSLSIGAEKLSSHAKMLEAAVEKDKIDYIKANHEQVMELYQKVLEELEDYFAEMNIAVEEPESAKAEISKEKVSELLMLLRDKLDIAITTEIEKVTAEMKQYAHDGIDLSKKFREIFALVEEYEYEEAYGLVEEILKKNL